jgi:hypothetical protein
LNVLLRDILRNDMRSMHVKFYEFIMYRKEDVDLSLLSFSKIYRVKE